MIGSGIWSKQQARLIHLLNAGGLAGEIADVRKDINAVLTPLVAVTVEEYDNPPAANATAFMAVTASQAAAVSYVAGLGQLTGSVAGAKLPVPTTINVITAGVTATQAPADFVINGLDAQGKVITETITGTNGGAATYTGSTCFAEVTSISAPAGGGTAATFSIGTTAIIGLSQTPMLRAGQALPLVRREIFDGAVVTNGLLTLPATNPPYGAYTPSTAPTNLGPATVTGTADVTAGALYGSGGTLAGGGTGLTLILNINGAGAQTLTFDGTGAGNDATDTALLAAIVAKWPTLTAVLGGSGTTKLVLTTLATGYVNASIIVGAGTANTALGLSAATTHAPGHQYAIEYEYNAALQADATPKT